MPDWMSHLLLGLIFCELFYIRKKSLVVLGALMPDFLAKIYLIFFYFGLREFISFGSLHTPIMCFLVSVLIAPLFRYDRLRTIIFINMGVIIHLLSDLTMRHFRGGTRLLFPFSMQHYRLDLIWPEQSIYFLMFSLAVYFFIRVIKSIDFEKLGI